MKILLTGTHFTPAVAVIEALKKYDSAIELVYIGRQTTREGDPTLSAESKVIPKLGVKFIPLTTGRLQRTFSRYTIPSLFKIPVGLVQSFWILLTAKPAVVVSFGGYVGLPVVVSAWLLSIPILIHEQTLVPGLANTISSWFADKIAVSFPRNTVSAKVVFTGNPLREEIFHLNAPDQLKIFFISAKKAHKRVVLITGGNQGAHFINQVVEQGLEQLLKDYYIIHQTGDSGFQDYERLSSEKKPGYLVTKFISNGMGYCMQSADIVVSRAGINSLVELAYYQTPAVVIPLPIVSNNEQVVNARYFAQLGLAEVVEQDQLTPQTLCTALQATLDTKSDPKKPTGIVVPDAAQRISLEVLLLANQS